MVRQIANSVMGVLSMNAVGIDVSKGKSMVSVLRPLGEVVAKPFEVRHTASELRELADYLKSLDGETRVILEHTGGAMNLWLKCSTMPVYSSAR